MNDVLVNKHNKGAGWVNPHVTTASRHPRQVECRLTARHDAHVGIGNRLATTISKSQDLTAGVKPRERAASSASGAVNALFQNTGPDLSKKYQERM